MALPIEEHVDVQGESRGVSFPRIDMTCMLATSMLRIVCRITETTLEGFSHPQGEKIGIFDLLGRN